MRNMHILRPDQAVKIKAKAASHNPRPRRG